MTRPAPWVKFFASDFLTGIGDLSADEIGVYTVVLALIWDRGSPIPDDPSWLARRAGTSTRRFNQIKARLVELGKLESRNGLLGNRRAVKAVEDRDKKTTHARMAALARWHGHAEPELPLGDTSENYLEIKTRKTGEQDDLKTRKPTHKPQKSAKSSMQTHDSLSRRRATPEDSEKTLIPSQSDSGAHAREGPGLRQAYDAICDAAGFKPTDPAAIDRAMGHIERWFAEGWDLETIILPAIRSDIIETEQPTRTLGRFNKRIRLEAARHKAHKARAPRGPPKTSNGTPVLKPPAEDPAFLPLRTDLLDRLGPLTYANILNDVTFEAVEHGDKRPLRVNGMAHIVGIVVEGRHSPEILDAARKAGFTALWKGR